MSTGLQPSTATQDTGPGNAANRERSKGKGDVRGGEGGGVLRGGEPGAVGRKGHALHPRAVALEHPQGARPPYSVHAHLQAVEVKQTRNATMVM
jgi:hypothetical protein